MVVLIRVRMIVWMVVLVRIRMVVWVRVRVVVLARVRMIVWVRVWMVVLVGVVGASVVIFPPINRFALIFIKASHISLAPALVNIPVIISWIVSCVNVMVKPWPVNVYIKSNNKTAIQVIRAIS